MKELSQVFHCGRQMEVLCFRKGDTGWTFWLKCPVCLYLKTVFARHLWEVVS